MCIIHDSELHYVYQNIMDAFELSKMISALFMRRVGCLICNCKKDMFYDSKTLISTQRALYKWFDETVVDPSKQPLNRERLAHFKPIIEEFRQNGKIDSGTKITFIALLKDLDAFDFSKLRRITEQTTVNKKTSPTKKPIRTNVFFTKLVKLKFDLKLCSIKEFCELLSKIDNCAIKYIQLTNKCKITLRDIEHLGIRNFMGEIDATIETKNEKNLYRAELSLKRLADAVHYRLAKQIPCSDTIVGGNSFGSLKILLQSPPQSLNTTTTEESSTDLSTSTMSSSCASSSLNTTATTTTSTSSYLTNTSDMTTTTTTSTSNTSYTTTTDATTTDLSTSCRSASSRSSNTLADSSMNSTATPASSSSSSKGMKKNRKHRNSPNSAQKQKQPAKSKSKSKSKSQSPVNRADESISSNSIVNHKTHQKTSPSSGIAKKSHSHHHISTNHHHNHQHQHQHQQKSISNSGRYNTFNHFNSLTKSNEKKKTTGNNYYSQHSGHHQHQHHQQSKSHYNHHGGQYNSMADNLNINFKKSRSSYSGYKHNSSSHFNMIDNLAY